MNRVDRTPVTDRAEGIAIPTAAQARCRVWTKHRFIILQVALIHQQDESCTADNAEVQSIKRQDTTPDTGSV